MWELQTEKTICSVRVSDCIEERAVTRSGPSSGQLNRQESQSHDNNSGGFTKRLFRTIDSKLAYLVFATFASVWGSVLPATQAAEEIFVASGDSPTNLLSLNTVRVYDRLGYGNTAPTRSLQGSNTGLNVPSGVAVDTIHDELFVANRRGAPLTIAVYDRFASGNSRPKRIISGPHTELSTPRGLAIDTVNDKLLVTNEVDDEILIFPLDASGDVAPRVIAGTATQLNTPWGIAIDTVHNELYISNNKGSHSITVYDLTEVYDDDPAVSGNIAPLRTIQDFDPTTPLKYPRGIALDLRNDELIVVSQGNSAIVVYPRTASGDTRPKRRVSGPVTGLGQPLGLALDLPNNELLVSNLSYPRSITVFTRAADGNTPPLRTLTLTGTGEPVFLAATTDTPEPYLLQVTIRGDAIGTVTSDPPGIDCGTGNTGTCQATFPTNGSVTLTERTMGTSYFTGWGGDCIGAGQSTSCHIIMTAQKNISAAFATHSLTVTDPTGTPNPTVSQGSVSLSVSASDSVNHALGYSWSAICPPALGSNGNFDNPNTQTPIWTAPTNTTGSEQICTIEVTVSDGHGLSQVRSYAQRVSPGTPPPPPSQSTVDLIFNGSLFHAGQTVTYQALIAPGFPPSPDRVDIYLGVLLPDGVTFASFVPTPSGLLTITFGPLPVPFQSNVVLTAAATVPFSYTFAGSEPIGTYFGYGGLVRAGTDPLQPSNRLSLTVETFGFAP